MGGIHLKNPQICDYGYVTKQPMDHWKIQEQIFKNQETNDKENMMIQPPWEAAE